MTQPITVISRSHRSCDGSCQEQFHNDLRVDSEGPEGLGTLLKGNTGFIQPLSYVSSFWTSILSLILTLEQSFEIELQQPIHNRGRVMGPGPEVGTCPTASISGIISLLALLCHQRLSAQHRNAHWPRGASEMESIQS